MYRSNSRFPALLTVLAVAIVMSASSVALGQDPRLCSVQGDPVGGPPFNLVDAFCIAPTNPIGNPGDPANVMASGEFPANAAGVLDLFVIWEPLEIGDYGDQTFTYSSSLTWANESPAVRFREWVGNFNPGPGKPFAVPITDSDDVALTPPEYSSSATSAAISDRTYGPRDFPPPVGRYHVQISGLQAGEMVTFNKAAAGGMVIVPEPSSAALVGCAVLGLLSIAQRRRNVT